MRKCRDCDFPKKFARFFDWRSDGTIISTDSTRTRSQITLLEAGEMESLLKDLSATIGIDIDRIFIGAQKNIGKAIYANLPIRHMKRVPANRFLRPEFLARFLVKMISTDIAGLGDGIVSLDRYVAGETMVVRFKQPVLAALMVGSVSGIYESIEDMPSSHAEYGIEGGDLVIRMTHGQEAPLEEGRLALEEVTAGEGPLRYERCLDCGVPCEAARIWQWDIERGVITNKQTGKREVVVAVQSVNALLRELENELGEDVPVLVYDHQKSLSLKNLEGADVGDSRAFIDKKIHMMALRGLGYPSKVELDESGLSIEITNAYNQDLYAAKLAAAYEKSTGGSSRITWDRRERDSAAYTISV
ncbi:MAG: hypothetical protein ACYC99_17775 [Candidatus Geothermincolia bacterium]